MRLAFAGTPAFAALALRALAAAGHDIALVLTQPDRPAGRGPALQASALAITRRGARHRFWRSARTPRIRISAAFAGGQN